MGDRTYVSLYIPTELADIARPIVEEHDGIEDENENGDLTFFGISEVNYATLECQDALREAGIPFTAEWEAGCEYTAGSYHLRFTPEGKPVEMEVADDELGIPAHRLGSALGAPDPLAAVKDLLARHLAATEPLSWDNQAEYGRIYVEKQQ